MTLSYVAGFVELFNDYETHGDVRNRVDAVCNLVTL